MRKIDHSVGLEFKHWGWLIFGLLGTIYCVFQLVRLWKKKEFYIASDFFIILRDGDETLCLSYKVTVLIHENCLEILDEKYYLISRFKGCERELGEYLNELQKEQRSLAEYDAELEGKATI
jgi:hypothetical protein